MKRYPGIAPFDISHKDLFKGRDNDIRNLLNKITINRTIAIHAASGTGKTSIINAAIYPQTNSPSSRFLPIIIRFDGLKKDQEMNIRINHTESALVESIISHIEKAVSDIDLPKFPYIKEKKNDLWYWAKLLHCIEKDFIFIFDQFENIESYGYKQIEFLKDQLAKVFNTNVPEEYYDYFTDTYMHDGAEIALDAEKQIQYNKEASFLKRPLNTKAIFVVREDKLGVLSTFADSFPDILKNDFLLQQLDLSNASLAISIPAYAGGKFESLPFKFTEGAINYILNKLKSEDTNLVDPFEIQIVCSFVENKFIDEVDRKIIIPDPDVPTEITEEYLPPITDIISTFYKRCWETTRSNLNKITQADFINYQKEIVSELVVSGKRVQVYQGVFSANAVTLLDELKNCGLVRATTVDKDTYYQLCHDRFIIPLLENLAEYHDREETNRNLKLYNTILTRFIFDDPLPAEMIKNLRDLIETKLIINGKMVPVAYKTITEKYLITDKIIDILTDQNLIKITEREDGKYAELTNSLLIAPILNSYQLRKAEEDKKQAEEDKIKAEKEKDEITIRTIEAQKNAEREKNEILNKARKIQRSLFVIIIILICGIGGYLYILSIRKVLEMKKQAAIEKTLRRNVQESNDTLKKVNNQSNYLAVAQGLLHTNPTLAYVIATDARSKFKFANNKGLNALIDTLSNKYPYFISKRYFFPEDLETAVFYNAHPLFFTYSEIFTDNKGVLSRYKNLETGQIIYATANNGKALYLKAQKQKRKSGYKVETKTINGSTSSAFLLPKISSKMVLSENGNYLLAGDSIYTKGSAKANVIETNPDYDKDIMSAIFTHDNRFVIVGYWSGRILIYNLAGKAIKAITVGNFNDHVSSLALSKNGDELYSGDVEGTICMWRLGNLKKIRPIGIDSLISSFQPDRKFIGHLDDVNGLALSSDGKRILSGSKDKTAIVWDKTGNIKAVLRGHTAEINQVQFSADEKEILTTTNSGEVFLWKLNNPDKLKAIGELEQFEPFDYYSNGLNDRLVNIGQHDKDKIGIRIDALIRQFNSLPSENIYPEDHAYLARLTSYLNLLNDEFNNIKSNSEFKSSAISVKRPLLLAYYRFIYKRPELLLQTSTETTKALIARTNNFKVLSIKAYQLDVTSFIRVRQYLYDILNLYEQKRTAFKSTDLTFFQNVIQSYSKKFRSDEQITISSADFFNDLSINLIEQKNYKDARLFSERCLNIYGDRKDPKVCRYYFTVIKNYLMVNDFTDAKKTFDKINGYENICFLYYTDAKNILDMTKCSSRDFSGYALLEIAKKLNIKTSAGKSFNDYVAQLASSNCIYQYIKQQQKKN